MGKYLGLEVLGHKTGICRNLLRKYQNFFQHVCTTLKSQQQLHMNVKTAPHLDQ